MAARAAGTGTGRGPKYRTSCDNCQVMKIKCGQEKPSCQRCSNQRLECVYSLSRRMGRPREKKTAPESNAPQSHPETPPGADGSASGPPTPLASASSSAPLGTTTPHDATFAANLATGQPEAAQDWPLSPPEADGDANANVDAGHDEDATAKPSRSTDIPDPQPRTDSLDCLTMYPTTDINGVAGLSDLPYFLDDTIPLYDGQSTALRPSAGLFDLQELPYTGLPNFIDTSPWTPVPLQKPSNTPAPPCASSELSSPDNMTLVTQTLLADVGLTATVPPISATMHGQPSLCIAPETDSWSTSGHPTGEQPMTSLANPNISTDGTCTCTASVLKTIESLRDIKRRWSKIPLDTILAMESDSKSCISRLLACASCRADSSTHLMGLMCIRMVLDLVHKAVRDEFLPRRSSSNRNLATASSSSSRTKSQNHEEQKQHRLSLPPSTPAITAPYHAMKLMDR